jgi:hypothetical protein
MTRGRPFMHATRVHLADPPTHSPINPPLESLLANSA